MARDECFPEFLIRLESTTLSNTKPLLEELNTQRPGQSKLKPHSTLPKGLHERICLNYTKSHMICRLFLN